MVTRSAKFIFEHRHIGLKSHGKGRAAAAVNYQTNANKCERILTVNLPSHNRHALKDHVQRYEDSLPRKDSRVAETFVIGFPREMSAEHREMAAQRFLWRMTGGGQSRAWAVLHHNDPLNPHMHANLLDRHTETGRPVLGMTLPPKQRREMGFEATGTDTARRIWMQAGNSVFEEFGYEYRLDCRSLAKQQERDGPLAPANDDSPEVHAEGLPEERGAENSTGAQEMAAAHAEPPPDAPTDQLEEAPEQAQESSHLPEDDMAQVERPYTANENGPNELAIVRGNDGERYYQDDRLREWRHVDHPERSYGFDDAESIPIFMDRNQEPDGPARVVAGKAPAGVAGKVLSARQLGLRVSELRLSQKKLETALEWRERAEATQATAWSVHNQLNAAKERFDVEHKGFLGGLKGFQVFGWKSPARRDAEVAKKDIEVGQQSYNTHLNNYESQERTRQRLEQASKADETRIEGYDGMDTGKRRQALENMAEATTIIESTRADTMEGVSAEQVYQAFLSGELTEEEALEACDYLGDRVYGPMIQREAELEEGMEQ